MRLLKSEARCYLLAFLFTAVLVASARSEVFWLSALGNTAILYAVFHALDGRRRLRAVGHLLDRIELELEDK